MMMQSGLLSICIDSSTLQTASAHSSIIEQLINKAEWFFPGGLIQSLFIIAFIIINLKWSFE